MSFSINPTIAIIGCGNLGTALASYMLRSSEESTNSSITIKRLIVTSAIEKSQLRLQDVLSDYSPRVDVRGQQDNLKTISDADAVIFAVKPVKREEVFGAPGVREALAGKLVISIMAGISTTEMSRLILGPTPDPEERKSLQVVRAMPNMAARIGKAVTLYTADMENLTLANQKLTQWIFEQVGTAQAIPESSFDISAVLVGCAGSLLLLAIDGLLDGAVAEGLKRSEATAMVTNSAIGMMSLVPAGSHPSVLREEIASPGGCSIMALLELEKLGVRSAYTSAILAATERSKSISNPK
ncbi:hypothetical protein G7054_g3836 [Neopestalotiopsis clavispora]|nr:hypothetical protein G7054_g3836 [Neopestalotiopsis clavispora]